MLASQVGFLTSSQVGFLVTLPSQVGFLPRPREEAGALRAQLEREEVVAEEAGALQRRVDECVARHKDKGGPRAAAFDVEAEAEEVRDGFEALARLGSREDEGRDRDEPEAADQIAARFLQSLERKGTPA